MLIDSNIIIYAMQPEYDGIRQLISDHNPAVSAISYVEVLGYHKLAPVEEAILRQFFAAAKVLPLDQEILDAAVLLRQQRKITLGDALLAATALVHQLTLVTHNVGDFEWIEGLVVVDPL